MVACKVSRLCVSLLKKQMRVVAEIPHPECRITIFSWNSKYLIKFEQGLLEQTYKVSEWDITEDQLTKLVHELLLEKAVSRFKEMGADLRAGLEAL